MPDINRKVNISFNRKNPKSVNILFPEGTMKEIKKFFNEDTDFINIEGDLTNGFKLEFVKSGNQSYKFQKKDKTDNRYISFTKDLEDETSNSIIKYFQHFDNYPATFKNVDISINENGLTVKNILTSPLYLNNQKIPSLKRELSKFEKVYAETVSYHSFNNEQKSILNMNLDKFIGIHKNEFKLQRVELLLKQANEIGVKTVFDLISDKEKILSGKNVGKITFNNIMKLLEDVYNIDTYKKIDFFKEEDELKSDKTQHNKKTLKSEMLFLINKYSLGDEDIFNFFFKKGTTLENVNKNHSRQNVDQKLKKAILEIKNSSYETPFLDELYKKFQDGYLLTTEKARKNNLNLETVKKLMYYFKDIRLEIDEGIGISTPEYFIYYYKIVKEAKSKLSDSISTQGIHITNDNSEIKLLNHIANSNKVSRINLKLYPSINENEYIAVDETNSFRKPIYTVIKKMKEVFGSVHLNDFYNGVIKVSKKAKNNNIPSIEYYQKYFEESDVFSLNDNFIEINPKYANMFSTTISDSENIVMDAINSNPGKKRIDMYNYCSDKISRVNFEAFITFSPLMLFDKENSTVVLNNINALENNISSTLKI